MLLDDMGMDMDIIVLNTIVADVERGKVDRPTVRLQAPGAVGSVDRHIVG